MNNITKQPFRQGVLRLRLILPVFLYLFSNPSSAYFNSLPEARIACEATKANYPTLQDQMVCKLSVNFHNYYTSWIGYDLRAGYSSYAAFLLLGPYCSVGQANIEPFGFCSVVPSCINNQCTETASAIKNNGQPGLTCAGNPINTGTGNKFQRETDYRGAGDFPLEFERFYNSDASTYSERFGTSRVWRYSYERSIAGTGSSSLMVAYRADGKAYNFSQIGGDWRPVVDVNLKLVRTSSPMGWQLTTEDGAVETYDAEGRLLTLQSRTGATQALSYTATQLLSAVTHSNGRALALSYDSAGRLATLQDPAGGVYVYGYNATTGTLDSVTYPDQNVRHYLYNETEQVAADLPRALTGIIDENGNRYATWQYDAQGRAISSQHAGGAEHVAVAYGANSSTVTDARGTSRTTQLQTIQGVVKSAGSNQPAGSGCPASVSHLSYDANGNIASRTDFNGNLSCYAYDLSRNLETVRVEGLAASTGCPADLAAYTPSGSQRKVTIQWHASYRLPSQIDQANQRSTFGYDANGNLLAKTVTDTATQQSRTWTYSYNALGQVLTADGPRTDVNDVTSYTYYADTTANHHPGDLHTVSNALGHVTTFTDYDANGRLLRLVDPNGLIIGFAYDPRGRLTQKTVDGHATVYDYDNVGNLIKVTRPTGVFYKFTYDAAHRLTDITDALGGNIHYTLDNMGNRIREDIKDAAGHVVKTQSRVYDALNRLAQDIGAYNQTTQYQYDPNGNLTQITDAAGHSTQQQYDSLDRLIRGTDALAGQTDYDYDALDRLTQVTDANNHSTVYSYNGLGDLLQQDSPNTGITQYGYDSAGNLAQKTDPGGITASYQYDALNRLLSIDYPYTSADVVNNYDGTAQGLAGQIGRLTSSRRGDMETRQQFDLRGNLTTHTVYDSYSESTISAEQYAYNGDGQITDTQVTGIMQFADRNIQTLYDAAGQTLKVQVVENGVVSVLADNIVHLPFGPLHSLDYGNGLSLSRSYDADYRLTAETAGSVFRQNYQYDPAGNVSVQSDDTGTTKQESYTYDALDRLTGTQGSNLAYGSQSYGYDAVGNRTELDVDSAHTGYQYDLASQKLISIDLNGSLTAYTTDQQGNIIEGQGRRASYSPDQRTERLILPRLAFYDYDSSGRRLRKLTQGEFSQYGYDSEHRLLSETGYLVPERKLDFFIILPAH